MAYVAETDVNEYGYLYGAEEDVPALATAEHRWTEPFPPIGRELEFTWEKGRLRRKPNVFHHNLLRDFACDLETAKFLEDLAPNSFHKVAEGRLENAALVVMQVVGIADVVDPERSLPYKYAPGALSFPHIPAENEEAIRGRFFRVPNAGLSLMIFVGGDVKDAIERAGLKGWRFEPATVAE